MTEVIYVTADMRLAADRILAQADGDHQLALSLAQDARDQIDDSADDAIFWFAHAVCHLCHWRATQAVVEDWQLLEVIEL